MLKTFPSLLIASAILVCSGAPAQAKRSDHARKLWVTKLSGLITDFNVARENGSVLVATAPDYETPGASTEYLLSRISPKGKVSWRKKMKAPVRTQAISADGSLAIVSTYDNRMTAYNAAGKKAWSFEGMCKPIILAKAKKILCYHDDDAEADVAFDVLGWDGKKIHSHAAPGDVLTLKISEDQKHFALAVAGGRVILFDSRFKQIWETKVAGEVADVAVSSAPSPRVAVLFDPPKQPQKVALFDSRGKLLGAGSSREAARQVEISPAGRAFAVYGYGKKGQYLGFFTVPFKPKSILNEKWNRTTERASDFASSIFLTEDRVVMGFDDIESTSRRSHLRVYEYGGKLSDDIALDTDEGAYLYAHGLSKGPRVVAATDDNRVSAYRISR